MNPTLEEMEDTLRKVCEQRDRARAAIGNLIDRFYAAHYNHAFDKEDKATKEVDGNEVEYSCSAGKTLKSVFFGCDLFDKEGICKGWDCPMGYHHRGLYEATREAQKVLDEEFAEKKPFDLYRIPRYTPENKYTVTTQWFARMTLMFLNSFKVGKEYSEEDISRFGDALASLVCIGLASLGYELPIDFVALTHENPESLKEDDPRILSFGEILEGFKTKYEKKAEEFEKVSMELREQLLNGDDEFALAMMVYSLVNVLGEYAFGHEYPGADCGVYQDVFNVLKHDCVCAMGVKEEDRNNFTLIKNMNNTWLDEVGFKAEGKKKWAVD